MVTIFQNDEEMRSFIPNIQASARGEQEWIKRIAPFIESACRYAEKYFAPIDKIEGLYELKAFVAFKAWAAAVGSIDLTATPNGFAVISNNNLAPASKERVLAAANNAREQADIWALQLYRKARALEDWNYSVQSSYFNTIFPDPQTFANLMGENTCTMSYYLDSLQSIKQAELKLATNIVSPQALRTMRFIAARLFARDNDAHIDDMIILNAARIVVVNYIKGDPGIKFKIDNLVSNLDLAVDDSCIAEAWRLSKQYKAFKQKPFENEKDSPGFFF